MTDVSEWTDYEIWNGMLYGNHNLAEQCYHEFWQRVSHGGVSVHPPGGEKNGNPDKIALA